MFPPGGGITRQLDVQTIETSIDRCGVEFFFQQDRQE